MNLQFRFNLVGKVENCMEKRSSPPSPKKTDQGSECLEIIQFLMWYRASTWNGAWWRFFPGKPKKSDVLGLGSYDLRNLLDFGEDKSSKFYIPGRFKRQRIQAWKKFFGCIGCGLPGEATMSGRLFFEKTFLHVSRIFAIPKATLQMLVSSCLFEWTFHGNSSQSWSSSFHFSCEWRLWHKASKRSWHDTCESQCCALAVFLSSKLPVRFDEVRLAAEVQSGSPVTELNGPPGTEGNEMRKWQESTGSVIVWSCANKPVSVFLVQ